MTQYLSDNHDYQHELAEMSTFIFKTLKIMQKDHCGEIECETDEDNLLRDEIEVWMNVRGIPVLEYYDHIQQNAPILGEKNEFELMTMNVRSHILRLYLEEKFIHARSQSMEHYTMTSYAKWTPKEKVSWSDKYKEYIPQLYITQWMPNVKKTWLSDTVSGFSTGINMVVKSLAFATLAALPGEFGLYSAVIPPLIYTVFGSSLHLGVGPSPLICLLTGAFATSHCHALQPLPEGIDAYIGQCTQHMYVQTIRAFSMILGICFLFGGVCRFGWFLRFFSKPIFAGFLTATAIIIISSQLSYLLFDETVHIIHSTADFDVFVDIMHHLPAVNPFILISSIIFAALLFGLKKFKYTHQLYSVLIVILSSLAAYTVTQIDSDIDLYLTKNIDFKFFHANFNIFEYDKSIEFWNLVEYATIIGVIGFMESIAIAKKHATESGQRVDVNHEMIAIGITNIIGSVFFCFPTMGSVGTTAMLKTFGAKTPFANCVSAITVGAFAVTLRFSLYYLPKFALGLIVISAVMNLIDLESPYMYYINNYKSDLFVWCCILVVTFFLGIDSGLIVAFAMNMITHTHRTGNTDIFVMGRVQGASRFEPIEEGCDARLVYDGIVVIRFQGPIFFGNVDLFIDRLSAYALAKDQIKYGLILDCSSISFMDCSGVIAVEQVCRFFCEKNVLFVLSNVNRRCYKRLLGWGIVENLGLDHFCLDVSEAVAQLLSGLIHPRSYGLIDNEVVLNTISDKASPMSSFNSNAATPHRTLTKYEVSNILTKNPSIFHTHSDMESFFPNSPVISFPKEYSVDLDVPLLSNHPTAFTPSSRGSVERKRGSG